MAAGRSRPRTVRKSADVFLNIPFDRSYERCYLALIAGLAGCGMRPRSVLEFPPEEDRLQRLYKALGRCAVSLHDLSRQRGRLNMPFEAGLAKALQLGGQAHTPFLLEAKPYRLQRTLSDLGGVDPFIHRGGPHGILRIVAQLFTRPGKPASPTQLKKVYRDLSRFVPRIKRAWGGDLYQHGAFSELVYTAQGIARQMGLP